jgi:hypothetical protein
MDTLNERVGVLERRVRFLLLLLITFVLLAVLACWRRSSSDAQLRVRSLSVIDEHGVARIIIAAPLPNPVSAGKESPRRSKAYGIQFNDAKANEFGASTIADDGALVSCFDWTQGEATCMFAMPSGEAGFEVKAAKEKTRGQLVLTPKGTVELRLNDGEERPRMKFAVSAEGTTSMESTASGTRD